MPKFIDLSGQRFGKWTVASRIAGKSPAHWLCRCDCGAERAVPGQRLRWGTSGSCGCAKLIDLAGKRFGRWTALRRVGTTSPPKWECLCDCGTVRVVRGDILRDGTSQSCGCLSAERFRRIGRQQVGDRNPRRIWSRKLAGGDLLPIGHPWVSRAEGIKARCANGDIEFGFDTAAECAIYLNSITPERCPVFGFAFEGGSGGFIPTAPSADRIDPAKGYVRGNIQIISMKANAMKANASSDELVMFAEWALRTVGLQV